MLSYIITKTASHQAVNAVINALYIFPAIIEEKYWETYPYKTYKKIPTNAYYG